MKQIAQLTSLSILIATLSNAGMVADELPPPPVQNAPKVATVINEVPPPIEKPIIIVQEKASPVEPDVASQTPEVIEEKGAEIVIPVVPKVTETPKITVKPETTPIEKPVITVKETTTATETVVETNKTAIVEKKEIEIAAPVAPVVTEMPKIPKKDEAVAVTPPADDIAKIDSAKIADDTNVEQSPKDILNKMEMDAETAAIISEGSPKKSTDKPRRKKYALFTAIGQGDGDVQCIAIGLDIYSKIRWFEAGNWYLTPYTEILASYWEGEAGHTGNESLHEGGLSVYGRYIRRKSQKLNISPYIDAGLGLHYVTENEIEGKELGRQWLAGSNIGVGAILGKSERFDVGLRVRHLSNAGTEDLNWGINFIMARLAIRF